MESIKIEELPKAIEKAVQSYAKDVELSIDRRLELTADEIITYIKQKAPRTSFSKDHLGDSFFKESYDEGSNKTIIIYSKTKGSIVHLIELGFRHRSGKYVPARPFLRSAYDELTPKMLEDLREIIKKGGL
ncbi:MAG: hypothetical protein LKE36_02210 [Bacilli bacterium]|jgi:hypothetical protein|nr:hypothetical protein [Bacilli bacterium]OQA78633.1 MAG: hypothetical protein BWY30_00565 [Tenericutes bacterium ADurb.Bin239]